MKNLRKLVLLLLTVIATDAISAQEMSITTSDSVKLYINIKGNGAPCLFIHGGPGQGSYYWEKLAGEIGENHFKMIYLDQRGCGRSSSPSNQNYDISRMTMDFEEVRKALDIDEWFIMGHSFGGILQTYYAAIHPDKIKGILMYNCTLDMYESLEDSYIPTVVDFFEVRDSSVLTNRAIPLATRLDSVQKIFQTRDDVWKLSFSTIEAAMMFEETYAGFETWNTDFSRVALKEDDYNRDYSELSPSIEIPTLFVNSTNDKNVGANHYKKVKFPNMLLFQTDGGHMEFINDKSDYLKATEMFITKFGF
jgi:proline iminopeptidase